MNVSVHRIAQKSIFPLVGKQSDNLQNGETKQVQSVVKHTSETLKSSVTNFFVYKFYIVYKYVFINKYNTVND